MADLIHGETVHLRHLQRDQLGTVLPLRVVLDRPDGFLLWAPAGTLGWHFDMPDGRRMGETPLPEWSATPRRVPDTHRIDHGLLSWHPRGADYSIRWFFRPDGTFFRWYANLEAPSVIWRDAGITGVDTTDWDLDVVIEPDRTWAWKDEELFAARLRFPDAYWVSDEERVRRAGREVIGLVEAGGFPFDGTWCDYRPDPDWPALSEVLPAGFDRVAAASSGGVAAGSSGRVAGRSSDRVAAARASQAT